MFTPEDDPGELLRFIFTPFESKTDRQYVQIEFDAEISLHHDVLNQNFIWRNVYFNP